MTEILQALTELKSMVAQITDPAPYLRGDDEAARYAGYKSRKAFRAWAREAGVRPSIDGGLNFWGKADINRAREKGKR